MIDQLLGLLRDTGVDLTAREVADALWLAQQMDRGGMDPDETGATRAASSSAATGPSGTRSGSEGTARTLPTLAERAPMPFQADRAPMPSSIAIARALRPLTHRGPRYGEPPKDPGAKLPFPIPVIPRREASFDLVLVVDDGASMEIWRPTIRQLTASLTATGAFRSVYSWQVDTSGADGKRPSLRHGRNRARHGPMAPIALGQARHQMVLVVSDCAGPAWRSGSMARLLRSWADVQPTAIVQVLPPRLWGLSALAPERVTWAPTPETGAPNTRIRCRNADSGAVVPGVPLPLLGLDARSLGSWAELVSGTAARRVSGFTHVIAGPASETRLDAPRSLDDMSPATTVDRFSAFASPEAMSLAGYFAAAAPLTLPVMRLIQHEMLPNSVPGNLAEVYLGGLLRQVPSPRDDNPRYDFRPGVRDLLFTNLTRSDAIRVMRIVGDLASAQATRATSSAPPIPSTLGIPHDEPRSAVEAPEPDQPDVPVSREPAIWGAVPSRNLKFTGRKGELRELRRRLEADGGADSRATPTCALRGLGGVGKTQIAIEYAHLYKGGYDLVWWVPAQQPAGIRASLSQLWERLNHDSGTGGGEPWARALDALRTGSPHGDWLVIFDNTERPEDLEGLIPQGSGHVIITSRDGTWAKRTPVMDIGLPGMADSIDLLRSHGDPDRPLSDSDAARIAEVTGRLPIALVQAAGWQADMDMTAQEFARRFDERVREVLDEDLPPGYPASVFTSWQLAIKRLREDDPGAVELLELCAMFAPEPIHRSLLTAPAGLPWTEGLPADLGQVLGDEWRHKEALRSLDRYALVQVDRVQHTIGMHRLIQAAVRHKSAMREDRRIYLQHVAHLLLVRSCSGIPAEPEDQAGWKQRRRIQPHLIPSGALACDDSKVRALVLDHATYLAASGDQESAREVAQRAWQWWTRTLGENHADTVAALARITGA